MIIMQRVMFIFVLTNVCVCVCLCSSVGEYVVNTMCHGVSSYERTEHVTVTNTGRCYVPSTVT